jgi:dipeptidyl aminopeptidase/acylaminoacyl peptidase
MKSKISLFVVMIAMVITSCDMKKEQIPPLIDREVFFDDPEIAGGRLSPDGSYISFLRPYEGTRNIWVKTLDADFNDALPVTAETERPIMNYFWSRDGQFLLYVMDKGGDENFNIYAVNPKDASEGVIPEARNITKMEGVRAQIYHISRNDHDLMFVGLNNRDRAWHDLYSLKISTGELNKIRENTNRYTSWIFDHDDKLRMATRSRMDGTNELYRMDTDGETLLYSWTVLETAYPSAFQADNTHFYLVSNVGDDVNLTQLYLMNIETGEKEFVERDPENRADFGGMAISDKTLELLYTAYAYERTKRYFKNEEFEDHFNTVKEELGDVEVSFFSPTTDESFWMVNAWSDTDPGSVYLYDAENRELTFQYQPRPSLPVEHLSPMTSIRYPSSDGLEIQAYLVLPKGFGSKNLPVVVVPHGGPWARDYWGFNGYAQFLANRGYAVLLPNFRGSTGFGKDFLNAGNRQWGELMQDDITWGVKYLIDEGIADPERVAIFGVPTVVMPHWPDWHLHPKCMLPVFPLWGHQT